MLRIDETSNTLMAPQAGGLVTEGNPGRDELHTLLGGSWEAFAAELGHPSLRLVAREPSPASTCSRSTSRPAAPSSSR